MELRGAGDGFATPLVNVSGQAFSGAQPPDTVGDVGSSHYIQALNASGGTSVRIYDKSGGVLTTFALGPTLGTGNCATLAYGDPIVLYDPLADRWLLSEFTLGASGGDLLCVYVSQTSDPTDGLWYHYQFLPPDFPDYPKYAVWPDGYYVATNEGGPAVYVLERDAMLQGLPATTQRFVAPLLGGFDFDVLTPGDVDGSAAPPAGSPGYFLRHRDDELHDPPGTASDALEIWEFHVDWDTPASSTWSGPTNVPVTEFDSDLCDTTTPFNPFTCVPQPGTSIRLDPVREPVMWRLGYRNFGSHETLLGNYTVDVNAGDRAGVRWFELRKSGGGWTLHQEGSYSIDSNGRWLGSIAMDGSGNIALAYNVSSSSTHPGLRYTGRRAGDTTSLMTMGETTLVSGAASNTSTRYGDYAAMGVDPADDCTFWFTGEYNAAATWSTRIGAFKFDDCIGLSIFADSFETGDTSAWSSTVP